MKTHPDPLPIGAPAPAFDLPATDGTRVTLADVIGPVFVYVQGCNHCPYVLAYLERLGALATAYADRGVRFVMVNSNDAESHPGDSFDAMVAFADEHDLAFPYLYDADQSVAKAYRTFRTPEVLVFGPDRTLAYHGRIDDSAKEPENVTTQELRDALDAVLAGEPVAEPETYAVGCTVKWKPENAPVLA